ncbi:MAG: hypothetical protein ACP5I4_12485 [Oceanipulchritudo sp.]
MIFCIDSDGCVFDNMRSKHEHAFLPAFVEIWNLDPWRPVVEAHWYAINLYSDTRGINRFAAFAHCLRRLSEEGDPRLRAHLPEDLTEFAQFVVNPNNRNADAIEAQLEKVKETKPFQKALEWSQRVNQLVAATSDPHKPFSQAESTLRHMSATGELHVVSQAPHATLQAEWEQAGLASLTTRILGQEFGSKSEQVFQARDGRDLPTLLVGDAPGDELAAGAANALFFPIIPQREDASWEQLYALLRNMGKYPSLEDHQEYSRARAAFHDALDG